MGRSSVYNKNLVTSEKWEKVSSINKGLLKDFLNYCISTNKSPASRYQYQKQLEIFFVWNSEYNDNKGFAEVKKREFLAFMGYLREELGASPNRVSSLKSVLSSLSNYIERVCDDEYPGYKNCIKSLEPVLKSSIREKTILSNEEVDECLDKLVAKKKYQVACFLALLVASGMRKAEALQMKTNFFTEDNVVLGCMYITGKIRTKGRGKEGKQICRYVFKDIFDKYLYLWLVERERLGIKNDYLFVTYRNGEYLPAKITTANSWAEKISKILGVDFYAHCARHYFVTYLKKNGYPDDVIKALIKWESTAMITVYNDMDDTEELESFFAKKADLQGDKI